MLERRGAGTDRALSLEMVLRRLIPSLVLILGFGLGQEAGAGGKVDWSDYLEPPGARPVPIKHDEVAAQPQKETRATASRGKAVKAKTAERSKLKKKRLAKRGKRR